MAYSGPPPPRYVIDGYNLLFTLFSEEDSLEQARKFLLAKLGLVAGYQFTVVFDNHLQPIPLGQDHLGRHHLRDVEFIYTPQGITADEIILEYLSTRLRPQDWILVTNDKQLQRQAKFLGSQVASCSSFWASLPTEEEEPPCPLGPLISWKEENKRWLEIFQKRLEDNSFDW